MRSAYVLFLLCALSAEVRGQYPLMASVAKAPGEHEAAIHSLNGGTPMVILWNDNGFTVRLPDMSIYRQVVYPPPPLGYSFNPNLSQVSETLFDTDPTTIEFMLMAYTPVPGAPLSTAIIREDGTILQFFENENQSPALGSTWGMDVMNATSVFNMAGGAYLMLDSANVKVKFYQLPGTFPCYDCTTEGVVTGQEEVAAGGGNVMLIFPMPVRNEFNLAPGLPLTAGAKLLLHDTDGRLVREMPLTAGTTMVTVDTRDLAAGAYTCTISSGGKLLSRTLVVAR